MVSLSVTIITIAGVLLMMMNSIMTNLLFLFSLNQDTVGEMLKLAKDYDKALGDEEKMTPEQLAIKNVGKLDPKRHLEEKVDVLMTNNVVQLLGAMLDTIVFK